MPQQFGDNTGDGDSGRGIAAQTDGKIVVVGTAAASDSGVGVVARYLVDGTLDPSFGIGGKVIDTTFAPWTVAVQPDGKIVAAGIGLSGPNTTYAFARYLPNGSLDPSFGGGTGKASVLVNPTDNQQRAQSVAIAPDGKIVAAGLVNDGAAVVRLNSDGTPDSSFDGDGSRNLGTGANNDADDVAVQPDDKVVVSISNGSGATNGFTVIRLDAHGVPDPSFGTNGKANVIVGDFGAASSVAIQPDGKIVVGGDAEVGGNPYEFAIARLSSGGTPDMSFSGDGQELTPMPAPGLDANGRALFIQPNGKIVLAGTSEVTHNGTRTIGFARYNPSDGGLDASFGNGGVDALPLPAGWGEMRLADAAVACDGKILAEGAAALSPTAHADFLTARILGDPIPCPGMNPPPPPGGTTDHLKPRSKIHRIPRVIRAAKLKKFFGTSSDDSGVAKVEIGLLHTVGKAAAFSRTGRPRARCVWLRSGRANFKTLKPKRGKCSTPRFLKATGTRSWVFKLRKRLPPGKYVLYARATDTSGNRETSFSSKLGNRAAFRVVKG